MQVQNRTAVVTGAAGGIGAAVAQRLLEAGARVVVGDLDADRLGQTTARLAQTHGDAVIGVAGDAGSSDGIDALVTAAERAHGPVDLYFANAGVGVGVGLDAPDSAWELATHVNVMGHVRAARRLVPGWLERGEGYFFSTASAAGLLTQIDNPVYSVTKAGAVAFADWLAVTYGDRGVRVSCLCPMGVDTALLTGGDAGSVGALAAAAVTRSGTVLTPLEVADAVLATVEAERLLCLPHPEVATFHQRKATDRERWVAGMQRYRQSLEQPVATDR